MTRSFFKFPFIMMFGALILMACEAGMDDGVSGEYSKSSLDASSEGGELNGSGSGDSTQIQAGQITAGEWNDLKHWDFWGELNTKEDFENMDTYWGYDLQPRITVQIQNQSNQLIQGIHAVLKTKQGEKVWESVSDRYGLLNLWPGAYDLQDLIIEVADQDYVPKDYATGVTSITINQAFQNTTSIEVAFIVDATGSMADELEYFKVELMDVLKEVEKQSSKSIISASVFYRDEGDDYVTKTSDFTSNYAETVEFIQNQQANGGGDFPEAVHTALEEAVENLQWSSGRNTKLAFLLLDAPPHYDDQIIGQIHSQIKAYSKKGIKLIPIAASGIDKETEFLLRYFAIATNGTYVFITNHSGIGNDHLEPSVGQYNVEYLNDLIIRLILEEIQFL